MNRKRKINFMLYGESSFLNKGCEAIVNTTIKKIKNACEGEIVLSTNDLEYDSKYYNDIISKYIKGYYKENELSQAEKEQLEFYKKIPFDYMNFEKIYEKDCIKEIDNVDICLSIGGDNYCYGAPNWIYTINKCIREKNKKNIFLCTSIFEEIKSDEMIRDLKTYDIVAARETLTYNALSKFMDEERLILTPDTAFSLEKKEVKLPDIFNKGKKVIGINISPLISKYTDKENNILESVKYLIDYTLTKSDYNICLIPHVYIEENNDLDSLKIIKELYKDEERIELLGDRIYNCEELKYVISKCSYLIAARTHASIAGYSTIVPTLVIGYSVKSKGIAFDLFGEYENYVIPVDKITPEILLEKFKWLKENNEQIKQTLKEKMIIYKEKADNQISELLDRLDYLDKKYITNKSLCTGCMACYNVCPYNAIKIIENNKGFLYTSIDENRCINCGLCKRACPANKIYKNSYGKPEFYAIKSTQENERINSSSGGVVCSISKEILKNNGIVYGATFEDKGAKHIRVENEKDLLKIMGSKYVQSKIEDILIQVQDDLKNDKKVLFTGTPCQIEGLKSYLNKEYKNLICISIICHGVPSPKIFKEYLEKKEKQNKSKIKNVEFRNKDFGWHKSSMVYYYINGKREIVPITEDYYMQGFLKNYFLRESCYNCQMRFGMKNSADIIVGDFWGIENVFPDMDDDKGISAVVINSEKGLEIFNNIRKKVKYRKTSFDDIVKFNPSLISSVEYTKREEEFFNMIREYDVEIAINILKGFDSEEQIKKMQKEINTLNFEIKDLLDAKKYFLGQIEARDFQIEEKETLLLQKEEQLKEKDREIVDKGDELKKIYDSRRWKYTTMVADIIHKIKRKKVDF